MKTLLTYFVNKLLPLRFILKHFLGAQFMQRQLLQNISMIFYSKETFNEGKHIYMLQRIFVFLLFFFLSKNNKNNKKRGKIAQKKKSFPTITRNI